MKLYDGSGNAIEIGNTYANASGVANSAKTLTPYGVRSNVVQTAEYQNAGSERWMEVGLRFKRIDSSITEFVFNYSISVIGDATKVQLKCTGVSAIAVSHDYTGGEMTFTDTFSDATKLNSEYITLNPVISTANVDDATYIGTGFTLKIAEIPEGLELIGEHVNRTPLLTKNILTYDETTEYQRYVSRWQGKKWMAIGDSITQGKAPFYHQVAGQMLQMGTVTNSGIGGTSLVQWAKGLLAGKYYQGYDLVTIMHGVNDHDNSPNTPIGELQPHSSEFDKSTYIGAFQFIIETIKTSSPKTEIALFKPTYVFNDDWVNEAGVNMTDYRNAIDVVANSYGLQVFDASSVITSENYKKYLSDGIHPIPEGQELLGKAIGPWLASI